MHKIHPEHDIFKKISTIYCRKVTYILTVQILSWFYVLGSHLIIKNNKKKKKEDKTLGK